MSVSIMFQYEICYTKHVFFLIDQIKVQCHQRNMHAVNFVARNSRYLSLIIQSTLTTMPFIMPTRVWPTTYYIFVSKTLVILCSPTIVLIWEVPLGYENKQFVKYVSAPSCMTTSRLRMKLLFNLRDDNVKHYMEFWIQNILVCDQSDMRQQL